MAVLSSVPDIGRVHDRERYAKDNAVFAALFLYEPAGGQKHLRGWTLRRTATREHSPNIARTLNEHTWTLRGYLAFNDADASELVLDDLVEQLAQQYNLDYIGREVIRTYVNMDTAARVSISRFVMQLTRNVERSEAEMLAQQATTENDPNAAEVAT